MKLEQIEPEFGCNNLPFLVVTAVIYDRGFSSDIESRAETFPTINGLDREIC